MGKNHYALPLPVQQMLLENLEEDIKRILSGRANRNNYFGDF